MIRDQYGRSFKKLRISLTQTCNIACSYCIPQDQQVNDTYQASALGYNELAEIVKKIHRVNPLEVVRLTGGEPLLFRELPGLIQAITTLGIDVKLTTNALLLKKRMRELKDAGLKSVNISLDTLDPGTFFRLTRNLKHKNILESIDCALDNGMEVKLNTVIVRNINEHEIPDLLNFAGGKNIVIRFLELMSMGHLFPTRMDALVREAEILEKIKKRYAIFPLERAGSATARYWVTDQLVCFGLISNHSEPFCSDCDRLRLDSQGNIYGCISSESGIPVRNTDMTSLKKKLSLAIKQKKRSFTGSALSMKYIGG